MKPRLYLFDNLESFSEAHLAAALTAVSEERRKKTLAYVPVLNRKLSVIAELLLRYAWRRMYGGDSGSAEVSAPDFPKIETEPGGKPYFPAYPFLHFNLSHCKIAVACALADTPVGVDVESFRECHASLARKVLSEEEQKEVFDKPARFAEIWTMKESYVKYTGQGLTDDLPGLLAYARARHTLFKTFRSEKGYACTFCCGENCAGTGAGIDVQTNAGADAGINAQTNVGADAGVGAGTDAGKPAPLSDFHPVYLSLEELIGGILPKKSYIRV